MNFELQYAALGAIRSRMQGTGGDLADCAKRLRRQVDALNGQTGFGVETIRSRIGYSASSVSTQSSDAYVTAAFLSDLERAVTDQENMAYSALVGAAATETKLTDARISWTPGSIKLPWWASFLPIVFPISTIISVISRQPPWWSKLIPINLPGLSVIGDAVGVIGGAIGVIGGAIGGVVSGIGNWLGGLFGGKDTSSAPIPESASQSGSNAATTQQNDKDAEKLNELEEFKKYVLNPQNWTDRPGGAKGGIDVDKVAGEQCADISKLWYMRMYRVASVKLSAWNDPVTAPMVNFPEKSNMQEITDKSYLAGDIGFTIKPPDTGHTFVIMSDPDANGMVQILEQNPSSPKMSTIHVNQITNGYRKK